MEGAVFPPYFQELREMTKRGDPCVLGDGKPSVGRGWCSMHYATWQKHGDPQHPEAEAKRRTRQGPECSYDGCPEKPSGHGLCSKHRRRVLRHGEATDPRERKFWSKVDRREPDECWPWLGQLQLNGYGNFGTTGTRLVHRIAYEYLAGPIPEGLVLDHLCHTHDPHCEDRDACPHRRCCNPAHLEPITRRENIERGRGGDSWGYVPELVSAKSPEPLPLSCTEVDDGVPCSNPIYKRTICRKHYRRWLRDPSVGRPSQRTAEERFWMKVDKRGSAPEHRPDLGRCWTWTAHINKNTGYGQFSPRHGVQVGAHCYSYELANGPIPEGFQVHHECHTRACVRPDHLVATTRSENMAHRKARR